MHHAWVPLAFDFSGSNSSISSDFRACLCRPCRPCWFSLSHCFYLLHVNDYLCRSLFDRALPPIVYIEQKVMQQNSPLCTHTWLARTWSCESRRRRRRSPARDTRRTPRACPIRRRRSSPTCLRDKSPHCLFRKDDTVIYVALLMQC